MAEPAEPTPQNPGGDNWWRFRKDPNENSELGGSERPKFQGGWGPDGPTDPFNAAPNANNGGFPVTPSEPSVSTREMAINGVIKDEKYGMETLVPESLKEYREAMDKVIKFKEAIAAKEEYKEMLKGGMIISSELNPDDKKAFDALTEKADIKEQRLELAYKDKLSDLNPGDTGNPENIYAAILKLRAENDKTNLGIAIVREGFTTPTDPFADPVKPAPNTQIPGTAPKGATPPGDELIPGLDELKKTLPPGFLDDMLKGLRKQQEEQKQKENRRHAPVVAENTELGKAFEQYKTLTAENAPTSTLPQVAKLNDGKDAGVGV